MKERTNCGSKEINEELNFVLFSKHIKVAAAAQRRNIESARRTEI
jgi:hypothetical protein